MRFRHFLQDSDPIKTKGVSAVSPPNWHGDGAQKKSEIRIKSEKLVESETSNEFFPVLFPIFRLFTAWVAIVRICHFTSQSTLYVFLFGIAFCVGERDENAQRPGRP